MYIAIHIECRPIHTQTHYCFSPVVTHGLKQLLDDEFGLYWVKPHDFNTFIEYLGLKIPADADAAAKQIGEDGAGKIAHKPTLATANRKVNEQAKKPASTTYGARYMRFFRAGQNPARMVLCPKAAATFNSGEVERAQLFATWSSLEEDWGQCEIHEERFQEELHTSENLFGWMNRFDLQDKYKGNADVVDDIIKACKKDLSKIRNCPEYPTNAALQEYWVRIKTTYAETETTGKRTGIRVKGNVGKAEAEHLLSDGGVFGDNKKPSGVPSGHAPWMLHSSFFSVSIAEYRRCGIASNILCDIFIHEVG